MSDIDQLLADAAKWYASASQEEREKMWAAQRESWVRAMTTGCEHGVLDFETCPKCREKSGE